MDKKHIVVQSFSKNIDLEKIKTLEKTHTYISDKLILDAINGVNVVSKDHHEVLKNKTGFSRILGELTGNSKIHQDMINENVIQGIIACTSWLQDHDRHLSRLDKRINENMNVIKDHFSKIKEKNRELEDKLNDFQQASINNFINIEERLKNIEIKTLIDQEIVKLESSDKYDIFKDYSLKIFIFMDNLFSGRFGLYDLNNQKENIDYLEDKLKVYLKREIGNNCLKDYINFEDIHNNIKDFDDLEKSAISYISNCQSTFLEHKQIRPIVSDLIKISSNDDISEFKKDIKNNSRISEFTTYEDYIRNTIREFK